MAARKCDTEGDAAEAGSAGASSGSEAKRAKFDAATVDVVEVVRALPRLPRDELERVARAAIEASDTAAKAAAVLTAAAVAKIDAEEQAKSATAAQAQTVAAAANRAKRARMRHCTRCHEEFDPQNTDGCSVEDHDESTWTRMRGRGGGWDEFGYGCCGALEGEDGGPCWTGDHTSISFIKDAKELLGHSAEFCWRDRDYAKKMQGWSGVTAAECYGCQYDCERCCTCGANADNEDEDTSD